MAELSLSFIGYFFARLPYKEYLASCARVPEADVRGKKGASWPEWNGGALRFQNRFI